MNRSSICWFAAIPFILGVPEAGLSADIDEFKVKRQEVYEFTERPAITRDGDKVTIRFASKAFCDATVAIEDADGKPLADGVSKAVAFEAKPDGKELGRVKVPGKIVRNSLAVSGGRVFVVIEDGSICCLGPATK
jgi:hypothetical protein